MLRRRRSPAAAPPKIRARSSSPAAPPACRRPRCSRTAPRGCAPSQRETEDGATERRGEVVMFGLFHMAGWTMIEDALGGRPSPCTSCTGRHRTSCSPPSSAGARATLYCIPGVWQRILDDGARLRHLVAGRSAHRDVTRRPRPRRRVEGALPRFLDVGGVRLDRDRARRGARSTATSTTEARQRRATAARWSSRRSPTTASCGCNAAPRCSPATSTDPTRPRRRSTPRAGSTPETSLRRTPTGTSPSSAGAPRSIRSGGEWVAPVEVESGDPHAPGGGGGRRRRVARRPLGRGGVCGDRRAARRHAAVGRRAARASSRRRWSGPSIRGSSCSVDRLPRTDATGQVRRAALRDELTSRIR